MNIDIIKAYFTSWYNQTFGTSKNKDFQYFAVISALFAVAIVAIFKIRLWGRKKSSPRRRSRVRVVYRNKRRRY